MKTLKYRIVPADCGRLDAVLARLLNFSRSRVRGLLDHEGVVVNGDECREYGRLLLDQDFLQLSYDPQRKYREKPPARIPHGFEVIYCDEHLVVVNKEAGILTVPTDRREKNSLVDLLSNFLAGGQARAPKVSLVHRLDRDTSGILVFGQRSAIADNLIKQFAARKPEREYYAIVAGKLGRDEGEIRSFMQTDKALNQKSAATGELAITHFRVITRYQDATLVAVNLETGRRNQIRVHFAELGHPILGDVRYEVEKAAHRDWPYKRLALHARMLGFCHPMTRRSLQFESKLPEEFLKFSKACDRRE